MKHKHADLIHAWADGAKIEQYKINLDEWHDVSSYPVWDERLHYRIKPEPKPDFYTYLTITHSHTGTQTLCRYGSDNVKFTYDGETRKLKSAEVI
jgi:hypothetical protein